ncbi:putative delta-60 repeat protein [Flavobacterium arsenatis]|uniref:Delta-60 repeat protein n=1 Tax=Flavobacterium arsenatis TaxID=1484332 RepID=A0ABU1TUB1_9FLAO|nr:T9SS type A sorting domain-containing protein [Flavobacterium arsenatis]MDR6969430.1 putative delta-60 repeat protein [Flavobacterium arsenatis]
MKKIVFLLFQVFILNAQNATDVDLAFGQYPGFDQPVYAVERQPDGKILAGGTFVSLDGEDQNYLVRLNPDGTKDTSFDIGSGFNNYVNVIYVQTDGKILVGGDFTTYQGVEQKRIIRLNADGTKDTTFDIGSGFNGPVLNIKVQSDGKIVVAGYFTLFNGQPQNNLVRLNSDGTQDTTFDIGSGFDERILALELQADGKILVGGYFQQFQSQEQKVIARLHPDGSLDNSFDVGIGFYGVIHTINIDDNGKIFAGGEFSSFQGNDQNNLIRLNSNGTQDMTFDIGTGFNDIIRAIVFQEDGKIVIGGHFTTYQGTTQNGIIRLNSDGVKDNGFVGSDNYLYVSDLFYFDQKILVSAQFSAYFDYGKRGLIQLTDSGIADTTFNLGAESEPGFNDRITKIQYQNDGKIIVGGSFTKFKNQTQNRLIRFNIDGTTDTTFDIGTGFNSQIRDFHQQSDGKILVGGFFTSYQGEVQNRLIRLNSDGSKDPTFDIGTGFPSYISSVYSQPDGKIIVSGAFTSFNGQPEDYLIRLNNDGSKDTSFNLPGMFLGVVYAICQQPDGKILLGGSFFANTQDYLLRLNTDGSIDDSFNIGAGFNAPILDVALQTDGKILVGGWFTEFQGQPQNKLIRLNSNGSKDTTFDIGAGFEGDLYSIGIQQDGVYSIVTQQDGKILVGGDFTTFQGQSQNRIIRLNSDGAKDTSFDIGNGPNNLISGIIVQPDGKIWLGGYFTNFGGTVSSSLVRLYGDSVLSRSEVDSNSLIVFPNPVQSILTINATTKIESLGIYDSSGKNILNKFDSNSVNVSDLNPGLYLLKAYTEGKFITKKFIKQ